MYVDTIKHVKRNILQLEYLTIKNDICLVFKSKNARYTVGLYT